MKQLLIFLFLSCTPSVFAQDTIVFADGKFRKVDVTLLDSTGNLHYTIYKREKTVCQEEVMEYSNDGQWYAYNHEEKKFTPIEGLSYSLYPLLFNLDPLHEYSRFSLSTNVFTPFMVSTINDRNQIDLNLFQTNPMLTIEANYLLHRNLGISIPLYIGFNQIKPNTFLQNITNDNEYFSYWNKMTMISGKYLDYRLTDSNSGEIEYDIYTPNSITYSYGTDVTHQRNVLFQTGISPVVYPFGQNALSLYIKQNFLIGMGDFFQVDYFSKFDTLQIIDESGNYTEWNLYEEKVVQNANPFLYFRYEALFGLEFNVFRNFNFSGEFGLSTQPKNNQMVDRFYFQFKPDEEYQLVQTAKFQYARDFYPIGRIHLIYKFGGTRL